MSIITENVRLPRRTLGDINAELDAARAEAIYGVVLDGTTAVVDEAATRAGRAARR